MTTVEFITALFYEVDEQMRAIPKHPEAYLWPSEVVTLGLRWIRRTCAWTWISIMVDSSGRGNGCNVSPQTGQPD
jgi:hypothetical protein